MENTAHDKGKCCFVNNLLHFRVYVHENWVVI